MAKLAPIFNDAQLINGIPANGAKLFTYVAGSSTKQATFTDEAGITQQPNPIVLDSRGEPAQPIWLTEGASYKFVFAPSDDTDPPTSPIRTIDNITGINDATVALSQWVDYGITPTYISGTSFSLPGDQTTQYQINRRFRATVTAGTVYGYISNAVFTSLTTITVVLDSGALDSGLTRVELGLITPVDTSLFLIQSTNLADNSVSTNKIQNNAVTTAKIADANVTETKLATNLRFKPLQDIDASVAANALTITVNPCTLQFRSTTLTDGTPETVVLSSAATVVVPNTATLGTANATMARLAVLAINNAGTIEAAVINVAGGINLDESGLISTTTVGTGSDSALVAYSTTGRSNVAYRVLGYIRITQATAGVWATAPTRVAPAGGQSNISTALNALGDAPMFACRAWVRFNGSGTVAINGSGNVSSITDNNTGDYTVNFTTAMPDANYSGIALTGETTGGVNRVCNISAAPTTSAFRFTTTVANTGAAVDPNIVTVAIFG